MTTRMNIRLLVGAVVLGLWCLTGTAGAAHTLSTHYIYDDAGQITGQCVQVDGTPVSEKQFQYDELGRVKQTRELATPGSSDAQADRMTETAWDVAGNVVLQRQACSSASGGYATTTYIYDGLGRKTGMTDAEGHLTNYTCDNRGHVLCQWLVTPEIQLTTDYVYDAAGNQTVEMQYEGLDTLALQIERTYDSRGHKVREVELDGQTQAPLTEQRWAYDGLDRLTRQAQLAAPGSIGSNATPTMSLSPATDRITDYTYVSATKRPCTQTTYGGDAGTPRTTTFTYDPLGRPESITDPNGNTDAYTYVPIGTPGDGKVATRTVQTLGLTSPSGADVSTQVFTYTYDWQARKLSETVTGEASGESHVTSWIYSDADRETQVIQQLAGCRSFFRNNAFGEQVWAYEDVDSIGRITESRYDQLGRADSQMIYGMGDSESQTTTFSYDLLGHRKKIEFADGSEDNYDYDAAGNMIQRIDPRGQTTTCKYNHSGQMLQKSVDGALQETFTYSPAGWVLSATAGADATNKSEFVCDAFGQVTIATQTIDGADRTTIYTYYPASGGRKVLDYPSDAGVTLHYDQDNLGQTTKIRRNGVDLATYTYAGHKVLSRDVQTAGAAPVHMWWQAWHDGFGCQARLTNRIVGTTSTILDQTDYEYTPFGAPCRQAVSRGDTRLGADTWYGYDMLERVREALDSDGRSETFVYDVNSNRISSTDRAGRSTSYESDEVNRYTSISGGTTYPQYDAAGNLTRSEYGYQFTYDYDNRLVEVRSNDAAHTVLASYTYDALGHRVKEVKNGQTTRFYYDGDTILAEYDSGGGPGGTLLRYHVHGPTYIDEHVLTHEMAHGQQPEREYYYLLGRLYSVSGLVDATGQVLERYRYDTYGLPTVLAATAPSLHEFMRFQVAFSGDAPCTEAGRAYDFNGDGKVNLADYPLFYQGARSATGITPYMFTGQRLDFAIYDNGRPVLVLYNYRARAYDAYHGRFLQRDPALYADSMNLYLAMAGNPLLYSDPSGRSLLDTLGSAAVTAGMYTQAAGTASFALGQAAFVASALTYSYATLALAIDPNDTYAAGLQKTAGKGVVVSVLMATGGATAAIAGAVMTKAGLTMAAMDAPPESPEETISDVAQDISDMGADRLKKLMSQKQLDAFNKNPAAGSRFLGQVVHKAVDKVLNALYPGRYQYNTRGPDFLDTRTGKYIELTTPGQVDLHIARGGLYADPGTTTYATYTLPELEP